MVGAICALAHNAVMILGDLAGELSADDGPFIRDRDTAGLFDALELHLQGTAFIARFSALHFRHRGGISAFSSIDDDTLQRP